MRRMIAVLTVMMMLVGATTAPAFAQPIPAPVPTPTPPPAGKSQKPPNLVEAAKKVPGVVSCGRFVGQVLSCGYGALTKNPQNLQQCPAIVPAIPPCAKLLPPPQ